MPKWKLYTTSEVVLTHVVEADTAEAARDIVLDEGRGAIKTVVPTDGSHAFVKPCDPRAAIDVGDEWEAPELDDVERLPD